MAKKTEDYKIKNEKELKTLLAQKREALRDFRFSMKGSRVRNTKEGSKLRKDIARILQVLKNNNTQGSVEEVKKEETKSEK